MELFIFVAGTIFGFNLGYLIGNRVGRNYNEPPF